MDDSKKFYRYEGICLLLQNGKEEGIDGSPDGRTILEGYGDQKNGGEKTEPDDNANIH